MPEATGPTTSLGLPTLDLDVDNPGGEGINTIVTAVNDLLVAQFQPAVRVYHSANQSIPTSAFTVLAFNSERFDTAAQHDTVTNNSRLTCVSAGRYLIHGHMHIENNATGSRQLFVLLNGGTNIVGAVEPATSGTGTGMNVSTIYSLAAGDYIQLQVFQNSGVALNALALPNYSPEFSMTKLV